MPVLNQPKVPQTGTACGDPDHRQVRCLSCLLMVLYISFSLISGLDWWFGLVWIGDLDWWFGGSGGLPFYTPQEPGVQILKPPIQTTNEGEPDYIQSAPSAKGSSEALRWGSNNVKSNSALKHMCACLSRCWSAFRSWWRVVQTFFKLRFDLVRWVSRSPFALAEEEVLIQFCCCFFCPFLRRQDTACHDHR